MTEERKDSLIVKSFKDFDVEIRVLENKHTRFLQDIDNAEVSASERHKLLMLKLDDMEKNLDDMEKIFHYRMRNQ